MAHQSVYPVVGEAEEARESILSIIVDNEPSVLARVVSLISARGYNIESLTVATTDSSNQWSRITIVTNGTPAKIDQIKSQLTRLVPVQRVIDILQETDVVRRELALLKVKNTGQQRTEALKIAEQFRARAIDTTHTSFVFEITGNREKINSFIDLLTPLGLIEVSRTGLLSIRRGSTTDQIT